MHSPTRVPRVGRIVAVLLFLASTAAAFAQNAADRFWTTAWMAVPDSAGPALATQTVRQIIRSSVAGTAARVRLSNRHGTAPLTIGAVHLAVHAGGSAIEPGTDHALTFAGRPALTLPPGTDAVSDPVIFPVVALQELALSLYVPGAINDSTVHRDGRQTAYLASGDTTTALTLPSAETANSRFFLSDLEVMTGTAARSLIVVGDSTADGHRSTPDRHARWPDALTQRLQADPTLASIGIGNAGISGNRLLRDGPIGASTLSRFDRDVLDKPGVHWILLQQGINDIGLADAAEDGTDAVSAQQIIDAMKGLIARAHRRGLRIWAATLMPYGGAVQPLRYSVAGEAKRQAVNAWIRDSGSFDAVVDFDRAIRDPARPDRILTAFDSGDHLHPNDAGYRTLAAAVDLGLFVRDPKSAVKLEP